jgi:glutathione peroxidase
VLGFPCDQFGHQEPGGEGAIRQFCSDHYGVTFPMFAKVHVNGHAAHPLYRYLKASKKGFMGQRAIPWNFSKFLLGADGVVIQRYGSRVTPERIEADVKAALAVRLSAGPASTDAAALAAKAASRGMMTRVAGLLRSSDRLSTAAETTWNL